MTIEEIFMESPVTGRYMSKPQWFKPKPVEQASYVNSIIKTVLDYFGFKHMSQITGRSRKTQFVYARQMCFYFLRHNAKLSLASIGNKFGGRDHTTVINGLNELSDAVDTKEGVRCDLYNLMNKIGSNHIVVVKENKRVKARKKRKTSTPPPVVVIKKHAPERFKRTKILEKEEPIQPIKRPPAEYSNRRSFYNLDLAS